MTQIKDSWSQDDFEDTVAASLIACYETKVKKNRGAAPSDRLTPDRVAVLQAEGPYIASNSRVFLGGVEDDYWSFDLVNDRLPIKGLHAFIPTGKVKEENPDAYLCAMYVEQAAELGKYWKTQKHGTLFKMIRIFAENDGIAGDRIFFTVTNKGSVVSCVQQFTDNRGYKPGAKVVTIETSEADQKTQGIWASMTLQALADRRYCWTITAKEKIAKAHLGCAQEEIKSLLYARSLPMTTTGRKRPILHLVESHKRRMRNGTDINVTDFLRGVQIVEIGGTVFKVNPPSVLSPIVSNQSKQRYFDASASIN